MMSDLVGGSANFDPIQYLGYSFVRADTHDIPHKTMVIDVDKEIWVYPLRIHPWAKGMGRTKHSAGSSAFACIQHDGTNLWTFSTVLDHKTENNQVHVKIQWDNGDVTWEPLNSFRKDDPVTLGQVCPQQGHHKCTWMEVVTQNQQETQETTMYALH